MSYSLQAFAISGRELHDKLGSGDLDLLDRIIEQGEFADDEGDGGEEISTREAIRELIMGQVTRPQDASQYGYALREICNVLGESLESNEWCSIRYFAIEDSGMRAVMERFLKLPIELPPIAPGDGPVIAYIPHAEATELLDSQSAALDDLEGELYRLMEEFQRWLCEAVERGRDLLLFYF